MKRSSYSICFTSIILLALVMLTSAYSQPVENEAISGEELSEVINQAPAAGIEVSQKSAGDTQIIMLPGDVPLEMVWIPPGSFLMGSPEDELDRYDDEGPQHEVTFTKGFWMGKYPITQVQWQVVMGNNPSHFRGDNLPVEEVSWNDIRGSRGYLEKLNEVHPGYNFRLPSEAEWEYAYRAGTTTRFYWGDDLDYTDIDNYAWQTLNNTPSGTKDVGLKLPNTWGLHDIAGNVWEWCEDDWHGNYNGAPTDGSAWVDSPRSGSRLLRGGAWSPFPFRCRAAYRSFLNPVARNFNIGFRVVCTID